MTVWRKSKEGRMTERKMGRSRTIIVWHDLSRCLVTSRYIIILYTQSCLSIACIHVKPYLCSLLENRTSNILVPPQNAPPLRISNLFPPNSLCASFLLLLTSLSQYEMEDPSGWSLTESDPQVFTQLLRDLGVKGLQVVS